MLWNTFSLSDLFSVFFHHLSFLLMCAGCNEKPLKMKSPATFPQKLWSFSHLSTTPLRIRRITPVGNHQAAACEPLHRNLTSPPSLWPGCELQKYHYSLPGSSPFRMQTQNPQLVKTAPSWQRSWRTAAWLSQKRRAGTYLMNVYEVFNVQWENSISIHPFRLHREVILSGDRQREASIRNLILKIFLNIFEPPDFLTDILMSTSFHLCDIQHCMALKHVQLDCK